MKSLHTKTVVVAAITLSFIFELAATAQVIKLGDGPQLDLSEPETETEYRVSTEGDELNVETYEREEPRTEIQLFDDDGSPGIDVRRTQPEPEKKLDLSLPI